MNKLALIILTAALTLGARAEALRPAVIPADAQWLMHWDVAAFKASEIGKFTLAKMKPVTPQIDALAQLLKFDFRKDLTAATVYGRLEKPGEPERYLLILRGKFDTQILLNLLKLNATFKSETVKQRDILSWTEQKNGKAEKHFGCFLDANELLISSHRAKLLEALALRTGQGKPMPAAKLQALGIAGNGPKPFLVGLAELRGLPVKPETQFLENIHRLGVTLGQEKDQLTARVRLQAGQAEDARQVQKVIDGLLTLTQLELGQAEAPEAKETLALLKSINVGGEGPQVKLDFVYPMKQFITQLRVEIQPKTADQPGKFELGFGPRPKK